MIIMIITSQSAGAKPLFACVVYTNNNYNDEDTCVILNLLYFFTYKPILDISGDPKS